MSGCEKCLICYSSVKPSNGKPENKNNINYQITAFFLANKLFELTNFTCTNLLKDHGNPSNWFVCCSRCCKAVRNARVVFNQLRKIKSKWKTLKSTLELQLLNSYNKQKSNTNSNSSEAIIREEICKRLGNDTTANKLQQDGNSHCEKLNFDKIKIELKEENKEHGNQYDESSDESMLIHSDEDILRETPFINSEANSTNSKKVNKGSLKNIESNVLNVKNTSTSHVTRRGPLTKKPKYASKDKLSPASLGKGETDDVDWNSSTDNVSRITNNCKISKVEIGEKSKDKILCSKQLKITNQQRIRKRLTKRNKSRANITPVDGVYTCSLCGKGFRIKSSLTRHRQQVHFPNDPEEKSLPKFKYSIEVDKSLPKIENKTSAVQCRSCEKPFDSIIQQYEHENAMHGRKNQFVCVSCKNGFTTEAGLMVHYNLVHGGNGDIDGQTKRKMLNCELCDKLFQGQARFKTHMEVVHENLRNFVCETCSQSFTQLRYLKFHQIREHNMTFDDMNLNELKCEQCGKMLGSPSALRIHIKGVHEKKYPFNCSLCNFGRFSKKAMDKHILIVHSKETPEKCSICSKSFKNKTSLEEHMRRHNNERPFECKHCDRCLFTKKSLRRHEDLHKGDVYSCEFCDKTFPTQHYLRNHCRYAHKVLIKSKANEAEKSIEQNQEV